MATFISGFAKGFSNARDRSLKREMFLNEQQEKRSRLLQPLREQAGKQSALVQDQISKLNYLKQRGFSEDMLEAAGQNPDRLNGVYEYATEGDGVSMSAEELANIYRAVPIEGVEGDSMTVLERLQAAGETYKEVMSGSIDPTSFTMPSLTPTQTMALETAKPPKKEDLGISAGRERTEDWQLQVFDKALMDFALLDLKKAQESGDTNARVDLQNDIDNYSKDLAARSRLTERYRDSVLAKIAPLMETDPDGFAGFENNLMIFGLNTPEGQRDLELNYQLKNPPLGPDGATHYNSAINPETGVVTHFYQMPDGSFITIVGN